MTRLGRLVNGAYHFFSTELLPFPKKKKKNIRCMFRSISCKFSLMESILSFERLIELARWINFEIQRKKNIPYAFFF